MTLEELTTFFKKKQDAAIGNKSPITQNERTEIWREAGEKARKYCEERIVAAEDRARFAEEYARRVEADSKEQLSAMQTPLCKAVAERTARSAELEGEVERRP